MIERLRDELRGIVSDFIDIGRGMGLRPPGDIPYTNYPYVGLYSLIADRMKRDYVILLPNQRNLEFKNGFTKAVDQPLVLDRCDGPRSERGVTRYLYDIFTNHYLHDQDPVKGIMNDLLENYILIKVNGDFHRYLDNLNVMTALMGERKRHNLRRIYFGHDINRNMRYDYNDSGPYKIIRDALETLGDEIVTDKYTLRNVHGRPVKGGLIELDVNYMVPVDDGFIRRFNLAVTDRKNVRLREEINAEITERTLSWSKLPSVLKPDRVRVNCEAGYVPLDYPDRFWVSITLWVDFIRLYDAVTEGLRRRYVEGGDPNPREMGVV